MCTPGQAHVQWDFWLVFFEEKTSRPAFTKRETPESPENHCSPENHPWCDWLLLVCQGCLQIPRLQSPGVFAASHFRGLTPRKQACLAPGALCRSSWQWGPLEAAAGVFANNPSKTVRAVHVGVRSRRCWIRPIGWSLVMPAPDLNTSCFWNSCHF